MVDSFPLAVHSWRTDLYEELHSRPSPLVETPCTISHIAVQMGHDEREAEHGHLAQLCAQFDVSPPAASASCFYQTLGDVELRWERHTEFSTYTFVRKVRGNALREPSALRQIPEAWLSDMPGKATTALHLAFNAAEGPPEPRELERYFEKQALRGGVVRQGTAYLYSSFRLHSDGFGRMVLQAQGLSRRIGQTSSLLRARVEISIQGQNRELLESMNRRSEAQLRLQQAVEGLSVVAITYYLMGLLSYVWEGFSWAGWPWSKKLTFALAVPVIMLVAWRVIHGVKRRVAGQ